VLAVGNAGLYRHFFHAELATVAAVRVAAVTDAPAATLPSSGAAGPSHSPYTVPGTVCHNLSTMM
jgi:hypothetical protein